MLMLLTRKTEFSASHVCRVPGLGESENRRVFGEDANPHGHGHNYVLEVTVEGNPDPVTGMLIDLNSLKQLLEEQVVHPMDHRFLNYEVEPFGVIIPTTENIAREIWRRLDNKLGSGNARLAKVRLYETPDLYVDVTREERAL